MRAQSKKRWLLVALLLLVAAACFLIAALYLSGGTIDDLRSIATLGQLVNGENRVTDSALTLTVIDVGQSSSALVCAGDSAALIDCGEKTASDSILSALSKSGVKKLDYLILTHLHSDHYGSAYDVINKLGVGEIIIPYTPENLIPTTSSFEKLLDIIEDKNIPVTICDENMERTLSESAVISFLDGFLDNPEDLNNTSLTMRIDCGDASFLITGDAEVEIEDKLRENKQNIDTDVLIAGHHGSATSSRQYFLNKVTPKASAISVGRDNGYNLPNDNVIKRLSAFGPIYRTDINGSVTFSTNGKVIDVKAQNISDSFNA